jgi:hypothetical protein
VRREKRAEAGAGADVLLGPSFSADGELGVRSRQNGHGNAIADSKYSSQTEPHPLRRTLGFEERTQSYQGFFQALKYPNVEEATLASNCRTAVSLQLCIAPQNACSSNRQAGGTEDTQNTAASNLSKWEEVVYPFQFYIRPSFIMQSKTCDLYAYISSLLRSSLNGV